MSVFDNLGNAEDPHNSNWLNGPGVYDIEIGKCVVRKSTDPKTQGHIKIVTEMSVANVVTSFEATDLHPASHQVGEAVTSVWNITKNAKAMGNLKNFVEVALKAHAAEVFTADELKTIQAASDSYTKAAELITEGDGARLAGKRMRVVATGIKLNNGNPFTVVKFEPVPAPPKAA